MLLGHPVGPRETRDLSLVTDNLGQVIVAGGVTTLALGVLALWSWGAWPSRRHFGLRRPRLHTRLRSVRAGQAV